MFGSSHFLLYFSVSCVRFPFPVRLPAPAFTCLGSDVPHLRLIAPPHLPFPTEAPVSLKLVDNLSVDPFRCFSTQLSETCCVLGDFSFVLFKFGLLSALKHCEAEFSSFFLAIY